MSRLKLFVIILILFNNEVFAENELSRQKRCIVIQKQSSGTPEAVEGNDDEDYDYKKPQPKDPKPDRLQIPVENSGDVETLSPSLKYRKMPNRAMYRRLRMKNRFL